MAKNLRTIVINVISGEALCVSRRQPVKKNAFVVVRTDDSSEVNVTNMDTDGGSYPEWNQVFVITIPMHARFFTLQVQCKSFSGDQVIGSARVPVSDFTGDYFPRNYLHFLSYRLRDPKGERNGIINLSVRVKSGGAEDGNCATSCSRPWMTAPVGGKVVHQGVAIGVPVW